MEKQNMWDVYIGVAVEDRPYNSTTLKVYVPELLPYYQGKLEDLTYPEITSIKQHSINPEKDGSNELVLAQTTNYIVAEYFNLLPNIQFPPFIRKGERVIVFRYRDSDKWFWIGTNIDKHLRYKEVYRISCSDTDTGDLHDDSCYYFEIDTLFRKRIILKTCNIDGEEHEYVIVLDGKKNCIMIGDETGNLILIDTNNNKVKLINNENCFIVIEDKNINLVSFNEINLKAGNKISLSAPNMEFKANSWSVNCPVITFEGTLTIPNINVGVCVIGKAVVSSATCPCC